MFLENMINNLLSLYSKSRNGLYNENDIFLTEIDDDESLFKEKCKTENIKRIIFFKYHLLSQNDCDIVE
jgi:hypothetical protein